MIDVLYLIAGMGLGAFGALIAVGLVLGGDGVEDVDQWRSRWQ